MRAVHLFFAGIIALSSASGQTPAPHPTEDEIHRQNAKFRAELQAFRIHHSEMSPKKQARKWLHLFNLEDRMPLDETGDTGEDFDAIFSVLPPPAAWPEFARLVKAKAGRGVPSVDNANLLLVSYVLQGDDEAEYRLIQREFEKGGKDAQMSSTWMIAMSQLTRENRDEAGPLRSTLLKMSCWRSAQANFPPGDDFAKYVNGGGSSFIAPWQKLVATGKLDQGVALMRKAMSSQWDTNGVALRLARIGVLTGHLDWTREGLRQDDPPYSEFVKKETPSTPDTGKGVLAWAGALDRAFLWGLAAKHYATYVKANPKAFRAELRLARLQFVLGEKADAALHYQHAFTVLAPQKIEHGAGDYFQYDSAFTEFFNDPSSVSSGRKAFSAAIAKWPRRSEPHFWLGQADRCGGHYREAAAEFKRARLMDPDFSEAAGAEVDLIDDFPLPRTEIESIAYSLAKSDPNRVDSNMIVDVHDLKRYWKVIRANLPAFNPKKLPPFPPSGQYDVQHNADPNLAPVNTVSEAVGATSGLHAIAAIHSDWLRVPH